MAALIKKITAVAAVATLITACSVSPQPGPQPSETPPRIVLQNNVRTWNDPKLFGPVPAEMAVAGQKACSSMSTDKAKFEAVGYHAKAENLDGKPFPNGGYYCAPKQ